MVRVFLGLVLAVGLALALCACDRSTVDPFVPNDSTVTGRDEAAPVQTDALEYTWSADGYWWWVRIPIRFRNISVATLGLCPVYPVGLAKRINGAWVPFGGRPVVDGGCTPRAIAPGGAVQDTILIENAEPGHNAAPAFASSELDGVYRLVLGYVNVLSGRALSPGDTVPVHYRVSNAFTVRKASLP